MNFLRRLFGQAEPAAVPAASPAASPPSKPSTDEVFHPMTDAPAAKPAAEAAAPAPDMPRPNIADGVTRPLPQEPVLLLSGHDHLVFGQATDVGMVRSNNQDAAYSFFATTRSADERPDFGLFIVADGMGGHHDGEKASAITTRTMAAQIMKALYIPLMNGSDEIKETPITEVMVDAVHKANLSVMSNVPDGGTTVTAVAIVGDLAYLAHVGDSRIYLLTRDGIEQLTRDHSLVQRLIELDQLTPEEAVDHPQKNVLYRALGQSDNLEVDSATRRLTPKARLLLCSDGLWNQVEEREIYEIVMKSDHPQEACEKLVALANQRGGIDNVTTILLQLPG